MKESELVQALQAANDAREEAQAALKDIRRRGRLWLVRLFLIQSDLYVVAGKILCDPLNPDFSRGVCGSAMQHI